MLQNSCEQKMISWLKQGLDTLMVQDSHNVIEHLCFLNQQMSRKMKLFLTKCVT